MGHALHATGTINIKKAELHSGQNPIEGKKLP